MIGGDLFSRVFLRFLVALAAAMLLLVMTFHLFERRIIFREWRSDLESEAVWLARHTPPEKAEALARAWGSMHREVRLRVFDPAGEKIADSHPDRQDPAPPAPGQTPEAPGYLMAGEPLVRGHLLLLSRRWAPSFPHGFSLELGAVAAAILIVVSLVLWPFLHTLSLTLRRMTTAAEAVSDGRLGTTVGLERSDELGDLIRAFDRMSLALARASELETRLLHDVSHELRSPLGRIRALAETIAHRPSDTEPCLRGIAEEVALLDRLVGDLIDVARLEADSVSPRLEAFDLLSWAEETLGRMGREATARGVDWQLRLPEGPGASGVIRVQGDPQRLAQALGNLIDNALQALEPAAGPERPKVGVELTVEREAWRLAVEDNGRGIPEADQPHLFRRFYRVDEDRGRASGGVGLGLSVVRAIVESHGGRLSLQSRPGEGTRVEMVLPRRPAGTLSGS